MAARPSPGGRHVSTPINRMRWATQRVTGSSGHHKRRRILDRFHRGSASTEKKRESGGTDSDGSHLDGIQEENEAAEDRVSGGPGRRIFFNIPLPDDAKDEDGRPVTKFERNKVRTAKYTPITFIPKNLWLQFHNPPNAYFLLLIILTVSPSPLLSPLLSTNCFTHQDISHLWGIKSRSDFGASDCHPPCDGDQRCN